MGYVRFSETGGQARPGYAVNSTVYDLSDVLKDGTDVFDQPSVVSELISDGSCDDFRRGEIEFHPPIEPSKIVRLVGCYEHGVEGSDPHIVSAGLNDMEQPSLWVAPTSTLTAHESTVRIPRQAETVMPGVELVAVVGDELRAASPQEAASSVAGYTPALNICSHDDHPGLEGYKMYPTFLPVGPTVVPAREIEPMMLDIEFRMNGNVEDSCSTSRLRFSMGEILGYVSNVITLFPGDIIATGSPVIGASPLGHGDEIEGRIESIGTLRATVRAEGDS